jgi:tetratricopeptide (TPR) repeat protein
MEKIFLRPSFHPARRRLGLSLLGVLVFSTGLILGGLPVWAQSRPSPLQRETPAQTTGKDREEVDRAWLSHREYLEKGDWPKSQGELEKVYQRNLDQGIRNDYAYSMALLRENSQAPQRGISMAKGELFAYANRMAPDYSEVLQTRAWWLLTQIPSNWENATRGVSTWGKGVFLSFANQEEAFPRLANISFWILLSFILTFAAFAISLLFRHYFYFTHHLKHLIRLDMSSIPLMALSFLFLFSPFFLGLGWMWLFVLWVLVFWIYGRRSDRVVTLVLLGLLLLLPLGIRFHSSLLFSLAGNGIPEILRANNGAWSEDLHRKLVNLNNAHPQDPDILLSLGLVEKRMGKWNEAEQRFLQLLQLDPRSAAGLNNLGNLLLVTGRPDQAAEAYQNAARLEPSRAEPPYNLGQAYLLKLRMKEAEGEFQKAQRLQPQKISYYTTISSKNPNRLVMDWTIGPLQVWKRVWTPSPERERIVRGLWEILWNGLPLEYGEIAMVVLFALLGGIHLASRRWSLIRSCERCGTLICSRCTRSRVIGNQCVQCLNAFTANSNADPKVIRKKRAAVARYQSRLNFLPQRLSWLLPGVGHLMRGRTGEGILYLFVLFLFLTRAIWWSGWIPNPLAPDSSLGIPWLVITVGLFIFFYLFVQYRMNRIRLQGGMAYLRRS